MYGKEGLDFTYYYIIFNEHLTKFYNGNLSVKEGGRGRKC